PFWLGEGLGRSDELSAAVGRLRARLDALFAEGDRQVDSGGRKRAGGNAVSNAATEADAPAATGTALAPADSRLAPALRWLVDDLHLSPDAARQIADYLARTRAALGALPTQDTLVMERFFDESGGTQLVIHSPFGSRINRAWGLALRKRFCRNFN
ncbi:hypothetical protein M3622_21795, partial [Bacillus subtilis]|nr:hypothetical protein [Bacillus subtilis]